MSGLLAALLASALPSLHVEAPPVLAAPPLEPGPAPRGGLSLSLGPAAWLGAPSDLRGAALLAATVRSGEHFRIGGLAVISLASSQPVLIERVERGATHVQSTL